MKETIRSIEQTTSNQIALYQGNRMEKDLLQKQDLMMISLDSWKKVVETQSVWLSHVPSTLVIKP